MTFLTKPLSSALTAAAVVVLLAGPVAAQETATAEDTPAAGGFDMGQEVDENGNPIAQEPQPGQQYIKEVFNDWVLRCLKTESGDDPCQMYQLLSNADSVAVAEIAIVPLAAGGPAAAGATIVVPLETFLPEQLTMRVDGGTARRFAYTFCNQGGCVARIGLTAEDLALFRRGNSATLRMVPAGAQDQEVIVTMSLSGFTAAFEAVSP